MSVAVKGAGRLEEEEAPGEGMATEKLGRKLEEEVACTICLEPFSDPVLLNCGHNFCQACVDGWWEEFSNYSVCPQCPDTVQPRSFRPNLQLAKVVDMIKELMRDTSQWEVCARHCKPMRYFCTVEKDLTCAQCMESNDHIGHRLVLLEDAVEEYKDHFLSVVAILTNKRKEILMDKLKVEMTTQHLSDKVEAEKVSMLAEFQSLHQFLLDQEQLKLAMIEGVEMKIVDLRNEHIGRVFQEMSSLDSKVRMLERMGQLPANELLKDAARILEKCGELLKRLDVFPPEPEWRIPDLRNFNAHLASAMKQFRDSLVLIYPQQQGNVSLRLAMDHPAMGSV